MYVLLILVWIGCAVVVAGLGLKRRSRAWVAAGVATALLCIVFFATLTFWGDMLWFAALGYSRRFWTVILTKVACGAAGGVFALVFVGASTFRLGQHRWRLRLWPLVPAA